MTINTAHENLVKQTDFHTTPTNYLPTDESKQTVEPLTNLWQSISGAPYPVVQATTRQSNIGTHMLKDGTTRTLIATLSRYGPMSKACWPLTPNLGQGLPNHLLSPFHPRRDNDRYVCPWVPYETKPSCNHFPVTLWVNVNMSVTLDLFRLAGPFWPVFHTGPSMPWQHEVCTPIASSPVHTTL